jgi:DNA-binding NtrC family response regulator
MVLLVEPDDQIASQLLASLNGVDDVHRCLGFNEAREWVRITPTDLLVSNLRLREFNGLQLVYCASIATTRTPTIVYTTTFDLAFAREVQRAGAFYDTADCLAISLRTYLAAPLPPRDRRDPRRREECSQGTRRRVTDRPARDSPA